MTTRKQKPAPAPAAPYQVGYGKPPLHTRFQKGKSGNPSGRRRRAATERAKALALEEAITGPSRRGRSHCQNCTRRA
jgi:hypothetical protein